MENDQPQNNKSRTDKPPAQDNAGYEAQQQAHAEQLSKLLTEARFNATEAPSSITVTYWKGVAVGIEKAISVLSGQQTHLSHEMLAESVSLVSTEPHDVEGGDEPPISEDSPFYPPDEVDGDADDD